MLEFYKGFLEILIVTFFCGHKRYLLLVSSNIIILFIVSTFINIVQDGYEFDFYLPSSEY